MEWAGTSFRLKTNAEDGIHVSAPGGLLVKSPNLRISVHQKDNNALFS
jgi:hypothetical protein